LSRERHHDRSHLHGDPGRRSEGDRGVTAHHLCGAQAGSGTARPGIECSTMSRSDEPIRPMMLGNIRSLGVRRLFATTRLRSTSMVGRMPASKAVTAVGHPDRRGNEFCQGSVGKISSRRLGRAIKDLHRYQLMNLAAYPVIAAVAARPRPNWLKRNREPERAACTSRLVAHAQTAQRNAREEAVSALDGIVSRR
jgi:hypothetical protein